MEAPNGSPDTNPELTLKLNKPEKTLRRVRRPLEVDFTRLHHILVIQTDGYINSRTKPVALNLILYQVPDHLKSIDSSGDILSRSLLPSIPVREIFC